MFSSHAITLGMMVWMLAFAIIGSVRSTEDNTEAEREPAPAPASHAGALRRPGC